MRKLEKRIILVAIVFVIVYLGAIVMTLQSRRATQEAPQRIESSAPVIEEEARLALAELLLPMAVLSTLAVCFVLAKRRRMKAYRRLDDTEEEVN